jgi:putative DNA primase/helicase
MLHGYILEGGNPNEKVEIAHGAGRNGKSVTFRTLAKALGDYAVSINPDTLMTSGSSSERSPERLKMRGARLIIAQEPNKPPEESHKKDLTTLDTGFLKAASGRDPISARFLHSNDVENFYITGVVVLITNPLPKVTDTSRAWWERLILSPFDCYIPEDEQDPELEEKFRGVLPGIMNWFIEGWEKYRENKRKIPLCEAMVMDMDEYRSTDDEYAPFVSQHVEYKQGGMVTARQMYEAYKHHCEEHHRFPRVEKLFAISMGSRFSKYRKSSGVVYKDIMIKNIKPCGNANISNVVENMDTHKNGQQTVV